MPGVFRRKFRFGKILFFAVLRIERISDRFIRAQNQRQALFLDRSPRQRDRADIFRCRVKRAVGPDQSGADRVVDNLPPDRKGIIAVCFRKRSVCKRQPSGGFCMEPARVCGIAA